METDKMERVEIELPRDIIFAMRGLQKPELGCGFMIPLEGVIGNCLQ